MPYSLPSAHRSSPLITRLARPATGRAFVVLLLIALLFLSSAPAAAQALPGAGNALYFDGVDDTVQIPYDADLSFGSGDFTVELWVQRLNAGERADLLGLNNEDGEALTIYIDTDNRVHFDTWEGSVSSNFTSTGTVGTGWTHIACVRKTKEMSIYINGKSSGSLSPPLRNFESNSPIRLGKNFRTDNYWLRGAMDELRIWRTARTQSEILQNMYRSLSLDANLIAYYTFDQSGTDATLTDLSANANHGQLINFTFAPSPWRSSGAFQGPGNTLRFDGSNDFVSIVEAGQLQPEAYTLEAWVNFYSFSAANQTFLIKGSPGPYQLSLDPVTKKIEFSLTNSTSLQTVASQTTLVTRRWYHLAATYSPADGGTMNLYVNGVLEGSLTGVGTPVTNSKPLMIGGSSITGAGYLNGWIDEVRIWNRARTADEVQETMARSLTGSEPNLAAYYRFDQAMVLTSDNLNVFEVYDWGPLALHGGSVNFSVNEPTWSASSAFNTWTGGVNSDWTDATNWSRNAVPASTDTVGVPDGSAFSPTVSADASLRTLAIGSGATLTAAGSPTFTIGGHWFNQGTFTPANSTVLLNRSNQSLAGSTTFNNLTKTIISADTLTFPAGETQTVTGTLSLKGTGTNRLALRSSQPGTQWKIDPRGGRDLDYLDVQDSHNINATPILIGESDILDSGNNTGWSSGSPPIITEGDSVGVIMSEDGDPIPFSLTLNATDPDGDALTWSLATPPLHGTAEAAGTGECLEVGYIPHTGYSGTDSFVVAVSDNKDGSDSITADVTIQAVDDPPVLTIPTTTLNYTEDDGAVAVAPDLSLVDPDGPNLTGVRVSIEGYQPGEDFLDYTTTNEITGSFDAGTGVLELTGDRPVSDYQAALRTVGYRNASQNPGTEPRTIVFAITQASLYFPVTEHFYEFVPEAGITWTEAKARTEDEANYGHDGYPSGVYGLQGYLATITSADENAFLTDKIAGSAWIGANDAGTEGVWRWVTGPEAIEYSNPQFWSGAADGVPVSDWYTNWNNLEPNDSGGNEDYAHMMSWTSPPGKWNDLADAGGNNEYASTGYMVEYGGMAGDPHLSLSGQVTVNVTAVNDAPTSADHTVTTPEDTPYTFAPADFPFADVDTGDSLQSIQIAALPDAGTLTLNGTAISAEDTVSAAEMNAGLFVFQPAENANGAGYASFDFQVSDGTAESAVHTLTIDVTAVNDAPVFSEGNPVSATIDEDGVYTDDLSDSVSDVEGDTLTYSVTDPADHGSATMTGSSLTYTPDANYNGGDSFQVTVDDGHDGLLVITFDITITPVNDAPVFSGSTSITLQEDGYKDVDLAAHFSDVDGDSLTYEITADPTNGSAAIDGATLTYTPDNDYHGSDSLSMTAIDGNGGSLPVDLTFTVTAFNDAPELLLAEYALPDIAEDVLAADNPGLTISSLLSDDVREVDGEAVGLAVTEADNTHGAWQYFDGSAWQAVDETAAPTPTSALLLPPAAKLRFVPDANFNGAASLTVRGWDQTAGTAYGRADTTTFGGSTAFSSAQGSVSVVVSPVNDAPVFSGDNPTAVTLDEDSSFTSADLLPLFSDVDGDPLSFEITTAPANGIAELSTAVIADGLVLVYTPKADFDDTDSLTITASDGKGGTLAVAFTFTVTAVNDAPTSTNHTVTTPEDTPYTFAPTDFPFADVDTGDSLQSIQIATLPDAGALTLNGATVSAGDSIAVADLDAGWLVFQPAENANGAGYASFEFRVSDGDAFSGVHTLTIDVTPVNDLPVYECGEDRDFYLNEDSQLEHLFEGCFSDPDGDALTIAVTTDPAHGTATVGAFLVYTPDANFHGDDSATVTATDTNEGSLAVTFHFHVLPQNDAPTSQDRTVTIAEDSLYVFSSADFPFEDVDEDALDSISISSPPDAGTLFLDANDNDAADAGEAVTTGQVVSAADISRLKFAPQADTTGDPYTTFEFQVNDGTASSDPANTLTIRVTAKNDAPVINGTPETTVAAESPYSFTPTAADVDGDPLTFSIANKPAWASFDTDTGALTGTPSNAAAGTTGGIVISVSDGQGGSASLPAFDLTVTFTNHPPVASGVIPAQRVAVGETFAYTVPASFFTDPDEQDLVFTASSWGSSGLPDWLTFDPATRTFNGTPELDDAYTLFVTVMATDPYGAWAALNFSLTIESPHNRSPLLAQPVLDQYAAAGLPFTFAIPASTFFDPDGNLLFYQAQQTNGQWLPGWLTLDGATGTFHGTPLEPGVWTILLTADDGLGGSASTTFDLIVPEGDSAPYLQTLIPDLAATVGTAFTFTLDPQTFVDPNGDPFTLQATLSSGAPLPDWLHFDPETLTFSGTPPAGQAGVLLVRVFPVQQMLKTAAAALPADADPTSDLFLIAISAADVAYLPANITGLQTSFGQAQVTLPAGLLPVHPHYALKIETGVEGPLTPAGWVSLERNLRVSVVDSNGSPVAGSGSASVCFPLSAGDWVLGNGEARSFAVASATSAAGAWRWLETLTDADRRTVCAEVPFGLAGLFVPVQPEPEPAAQLPATGFAPGRVTPLPPQSAENAYDRLGSLWLEIPRLGVQAEIVGVPYHTDRAWDVTWLGARAGWLESTAFPTWAGNSLLAAHAVDAGGRPGPFARLSELRYGDRIVVHLFGQRYVYEVRTVDAFIAPDDTRALRHEDLPWLTLVTCRGYDENSGEYRWRTVVRAVQVSIEE